jgi:uncharacterized membrane protein YbaN (DUF454 family)
MNRWARWALAFGFFLLGLIGILVPVMPQFAFFAVTVLLLSPDFPPARRLVNWMFRKWPKLRRAVPKRLRDEAKKAPAK